MGLGVPEFYGNDQRFLRTGTSPGGRPVYTGRFQKGISYRPDPLNNPSEYRAARPDLKPVGGGGLKSDEGDAIVHLPPKANAAFAFEFRHLDGESVTMRFEGASNAPIEKLSDTKAIYRDVFTNTDLEVTVKSDGWKVDWIYKAAGHPTDITVQYTAPFDRDIVFVNERRAQINVHTDGSTDDFSYFKLLSPFWQGDDDDQRYMTIAPGAGNRFVYTMPDMSDVAYPFVFDPTATYFPDASVEVDTVDGWTERRSRCVRTLRLAATTPPCAVGTSASTPVCWPVTGSAA
jgi:hypothetical protein